MKHCPHFILAILLLALHSCSIESDPLIVNEVGEDCALYDIFVDEFGNEGIIASIYEEEDEEYGVYKYIIAISADEGYEAWGPMGEAVYKSNAISFDTITSYYILLESAFGLMMQQSMKSLGINRFPAQQWCDQKNQGDPYPNAASWRLPSIYEWMEIIENPGLNDALVSIGGTPLDDDHYYWTCTEDIEGLITFNDSTTYDKENRAIISNTSAQAPHDKDYWLKKNKYHVRAIKYVYYKEYNSSKD